MCRARASYLLFDAVVYSNAAKSSVLGVSDEILRAYGAVSEECADAPWPAACCACPARISACRSPASRAQAVAPTRSRWAPCWISVASKGGAVFARHFRLWGGREDPHAECLHGAEDGAEVGDGARAVDRAPAEPPPAGSPRLFSKGSIALASA